MKGQKTYEAALTKLQSYIREKNLRRSPVREMVLEKLCLLPQPFTAEQLEQTCLEERISRATIYNSLKLFIEAHLLHPINRHQGEGITFYELSTGKQVRMQMICKTCGRVVEFRDKALDHLIRIRKYPNFELNRYTIYIYGECKHHWKPKKSKE